MTIGRHSSQRGLTLIETLVAISIFSIMTLGLVPLLGAAMKGGATSRTESVGRNITAKTLERLRGLQYHTAYSPTTLEVDLLDYFFPKRTPALTLPTVSTGFDAATNSYVTTCTAATSATVPCKVLSAGTQLPAGHAITVTATFKNPDNPTTTVPVPVAYAWDSPGNDTPPSQLLEVRVHTTWPVGATQRSFTLTSFLSDRGKRGSQPQAATPAPPEPPAASGVPENIKLRAEARIDYAVEATTTFQDTQVPPRKSEMVGTMGTALAYGEQLASGSKADLSVRSGSTTMIRPANPNVPGDAGYSAAITGATMDAHAPSDATSTVVNSTSVGQSLQQTEIDGNGWAWWPPVEAGTLSGLGGIGPKVTNSLPTVRGYYDFNSTSAWFPQDISNALTKAHMMFNPQVPLSGAVPGAGSVNPLNLALSSSNKMLLVADAIPTGTDPRGEVEVHSTATTPGGSRVVRSDAHIVTGGTVHLTPTHTSSFGKRGAIDFMNFTARVTCEAKADPSAASTATGSWSATLRYYGDSVNNNKAEYLIQQITLPTQTLTGYDVPYGNTNPLAYLKTMNAGNGPLIHDNSNNLYDVWMFAANGKIGLVKDWSMGAIQTSISADDRVASATLNGAIRVETVPLLGPWGASQKPESDLTVSIGKLSCKSEDYR